MGGLRSGWDGSPMPENSSPTPTPARRTRPGFIVAGALTAVVATGALLAGGVALWADGKKDADGYLTTTRHDSRAAPAARATDNLDVNLDGAQSLVDSGAFGKVRLKVTAKNAKPVFVGIARTRDVESYLRGVAHTTLTDIDSDPFEARYRDHGGRRSATQPARRTIWSASTQ